MRGCLRIGTVIGLFTVIAGCSSDDTPGSGASGAGGQQPLPSGQAGSPANAGAPGQPQGGAGPSAGAPSAGSANAGAPSAGSANAGAPSAGSANAGSGGGASSGAGAPSGGAATHSGGSSSVNGGGSALGGVGAGGGAAGSAAGSPGGKLDPSAIIVQDDFDKGAADGWPDEAKWTPYEDWARQQGIAPTIDATKSHSPPNSVRVQSSNVGLGSFLVPAMGFPVQTNAFYVRVWMNWEKATSSILGHSGFLVGATARDNSGTEVRLGLSNKGPGDEAMLDLNLIGGSGGEVTRYSNGFTDGGDPAKASGNGFQFAANTWVCLEAFFNGAGHEFRVWVNDMEVEAMHVTDFRGGPSGEPRTTWAPMYTFLKIGAQDYDANLGKIWYDDVVVAKERVGCQ